MNIFGIISGIFKSRRQNKKLKKTFKDAADQLQFILDDSNKMSSPPTIIEYNDRLSVLNDQRNMLKHKNKEMLSSSNYSIKIKLLLDNDLAQVKTKIDLLKHSKKNFSKELVKLNKKYKKIHLNTEEIIHKINCINEMILNAQISDEHRSNYIRQTCELNKELKECNRLTEKYQEKISRYGKEITSHSKHIDFLNNKYLDISGEISKNINNNSVLKDIELIKTDIFLAENDVNKLYQKIIKCEREKGELIKKMNSIIKTCFDKVMVIEKKLNESPRWNRRTLSKINNFRSGLNSLKSYLNALESYNSVAWIDNHKKAIKYSRCLEYAHNLLVDPHNASKDIEEAIKYMNNDRNSFFNNDLKHNDVEDSDEGSPYYRISCGEE